ncbi:hypothetical protein AZF37_05855 [endosymbiont 'TC1' of Trimyema compressum]|nr:hypothetical protein AZF37_05855 [endosymbiont 'TC1' of Trimyema compressum]
MYVKYYNEGATYKYTSSREKCSCWHSKLNGPGINSYCFKKWLSKNKISELSVKELCQIKGIVKAKAITLLAALELGKRCLLFEELTTPIITSSKKLHRFWKKNSWD